MRRSPAAREGVADDRGRMHAPLRLARQASPGSAISHVATGLQHATSDA